METTLRRAAIIATAVLAIATGAIAGPSDDTLTIGLKRAPDNLHPYRDTTREQNVLKRQIFDTLIYIDPYTFEMKPGLATEWVEIDDLTIELTIREGVTFHDGSVLTPEDVVWTINHIVGTSEENGYTNASRYRWIDRAELLDDGRVRIVSAAPNPIRLVRLGWTPILSQSATEALGVDGMDLMPVGTGPYRVAEHDIGGEIVLEKFEAFGDRGDKPAAQIGTVVVRSIPSDETRVAELLTGGIEWDFSLPADLVDGVRGNPALTVTAAPTFRMASLQVESTGASGQPALADPRVRKAIFHAINRPEILAAFWGQTAEDVLDVYCVPGIALCDPDGVPPIEFDPEAARALLAEAGYPDGFEVTITSPNSHRENAAIASYLEEVGIRTRVEQLPSSTFWEKRAANEVQMAFVDFGGSQLGDYIAGVHDYISTHGRRDFARNDRIRDLTAEAMGTTNPTIREAAADEINAILSEQHYYLPFNVWTRLYVYSSELDWTPSPDELPRFNRAAWKN